MQRFWTSFVIREAQDKTTKRFLWNGYIQTTDNIKCCWKWRETGTHTVLVKGKIAQQFRETIVSKKFKYNLAYNSSVLPSTLWKWKYVCPNIYTGMFMAVLLIIVKNK